MASFTVVGFQCEPEEEDNYITNFDGSDNTEDDKEDEIKNARSISISDIKTWCMWQMKTYTH